MEAPNSKGESHEQQGSGKYSPWDPGGGLAVFLRSDVQLRHSFQCVFGRRGSRRRQVLGDGLLFVHAEMAGVGADEAFIEDAAGKLLETLFFQSAQEVGANFGGQGDFIQRDFSLLAFPFQSRPERFHAATTCGRS
jgi:hypothetical protein